MNNQRTRGTPIRFDPRHNNFDLLRLFAASEVAFIHVSTNLDIQFSGIMFWVERFMGYFPGVPIFFIISGFLISASLERNPNLRDYTLNRCLRIYPALWVATLVTLAVLLIFGGRAWEAVRLSGQNPLWVTIQWLTAQFSIAQFWTPAPFKNFGVGLLNGSLWTIPVELQFYLALPLLARLLWRGLPPASRNFRLFAATAILFAGSWLFTTHKEAFIAFNGKLAVLIRLSLLPYLHFFLLGIAIQLNQDRLARWLHGKGLHWLAAYLLFAYGLAKVYDVPKNIYLTNLPLMMVLAMTVASLAFTGRHLSEKLLRGHDISYGTYIYHGIVLNIAYELGYVGRIGAFWTILALSFLIALLSWLAIEEPALSLKRHPLLERGHHPSLSEK